MICQCASCGRRIRLCAEDAKEFAPEERECGKCAIWRWTYQSRGRRKKLRQWKQELRSLKRMLWHVTMIQKIRDGLSMTMEAGR